MHVQSLSRHTFDPTCADRKRNDEPAATASVKIAIGSPRTDSDGRTSETFPRNTTPTAATPHGNGVDDRSEGSCKGIESVVLVSVRLLEVDKKTPSEVNTKKGLFL